MKKYLVCVIAICCFFLSNKISFCSENNGIDGDKIVNNNTNTVVVETPLISLNKDGNNDNGTNKLTTINYKLTQNQLIDINKEISKDIHKSISTLSNDGIKRISNMMLIIDDYINSGKKVKDENNADTYVKFNKVEQVNLLKAVKKNFSESTHKNIKDIKFKMFMLEDLSRSKVNNKKDQSNKKNVISCMFKNPNAFILDAETKKNVKHNIESLFKVQFSVPKSNYEITDTKENFGDFVGNVVSNLRIEYFGDAKREENQTVGEEIYLVNFIENTFIREINRIANIGMEYSAITKVYSTTIVAMTGQLLPIYENQLQHLFLENLEEKIKEVNLLIKDEKIAELNKSLEDAYLNFEFKNEEQRARYDEIVEYLENRKINNN